MQEGKILAAHHDGAYVLRLEGDVRLTLCTTIDEYFQRMFDDPEFASVWVDLCGAEGIDSTTLGMLAKLALQVEEKFVFQPGIAAYYYSRNTVYNLINLASQLTDGQDNGTGLHNYTK